MKAKALTKLLTACLICSLILTLAACGGTQPSSDIPSDSGSIIEPSDDTSSGDGESTSAELPDVPPTKELLDKIVAAYAKNPDTVGWLYIPNTNINDVVVQNPPDDTRNEYYLRKDWMRNYDFNGCYMADYECRFESADISRNTVIYGHNMDDKTDGVMFGQLTKWRDIDFAKNNPYIYFSTPERDMVWKIFSVMNTSTKFDYVQTDPDNTKFMNMLNHARKASIYNYEVDVTASDKVLTLSTCTYVYGSNNKSQRFVIMARLLRPGEEISPQVTLEKNPSPLQPTF